MVTRSASRLRKVVQDFKGMNTLNSAIPKDNLSVVNASDLCDLCFTKDGPTKMPFYPNGPYWVECSKCLVWAHNFCWGLTNRKAPRDWICLGCDSSKFLYLQRKELRQIPEGKAIVNSKSCPKLLSTPANSNKLVKRLTLNSQVTSSPPSPVSVLSSNLSIEKDR